MPIISGADGCKGGWVVASKDMDTGNVSWQTFATLRDLVKGLAESQILAIDIPIGLPERAPA